MPEARSLVFAITAFFLVGSKDTPDRNLVKKHFVKFQETLLPIEERIRRYEKQTRGLTPGK
jgi:hypothetical protein